MPGLLPFSRLPAEAASLHGYMARTPFALLQRCPVSFLKERGQLRVLVCDLSFGCAPPAVGRAGLRRRGQGSARRVDRAAAVGP